MISFLCAVIYGSTFLEFNEILFPPKLASPNFWALIVAYYTAFAGWFGYRAMVRYRPYSDKLVSRIRALLELISAINYLALMYFASRVDESLAEYLWGFVVLFIIYIFMHFVCQLDVQRPEPIDLDIIYGLPLLAAAAAYGIWSLVFPPIPQAVSWLFIFVPLIIMVSYRLTMRAKRTWRPEYDERHLKMGRTA
ncbi:MAG: hypothetical protein ACFFAK_18460 [Promethearchaeota archaeon]